MAMRPRTPSLSAMPFTSSSSAAILHNAADRLRRAAIDDAALEAELLLAHALGPTREQLFARLSEPLDCDQRQRFEQLIERRLAHEPLAYITGHKEFYGLDLICSPAALIPRPETELLVELALDWLSITVIAAPIVVDVGTGTGAIALAIAAHAAHARIVAIDTSRASLEVAATNAERLGVRDRVSLVQGSLLEALQAPADVIVANLPYIADDVYATLPPEIRQHEPDQALRAGGRGTELIESLIEQAPTLLRSGGLLLTEHAWDQGESLRRAARVAFPYARIETKRDLAALERALVVQT
jgi:release factor glutamine methyltransferase